MMHFLKLTFVTVFAFRKAFKVLSTVLALWKDVGLCTVKPVPFT